ncbi:tetratricopeptide repeat protein [Virgibacillus profundi]|nr:tetratricopeptide repeat protein [Virgibacillus profundi]
MDILNLDEKVKEIIRDENKADLEVIIEEFKRNHFPNVLSKSKKCRQKYSTDEKLKELLSIVEAVSHAQIGENSTSAEIISSLYKSSSRMTSDDLILYAELAFMSDYKLARRIMSEAVKQMENDEETDRIKLARGFLVLGEAEENLEKFARAIRYYQRGLTYFQDDDNRDKYMILFLHFKLGVLYSTVNNSEEAINYLNKTVELAGDDHPEMKINSLVSIAKTYGSKEEDKKAYAYLTEAIELLDDSSLAETLVHAEAFTEMAFYYFNQSELDEAIPNYTRAIEIFLNLPAYSARKIGMIYMQYAYCLEHKKQPNQTLAGRNYELAIEKLEKTDDKELLENALADVISFFDNTNNPRKKKYFENKFVNMTNVN